MFKFIKKIFYISLLVFLLWLGWNFSGEVKDIPDLKKQSLELVSVAKSKLYFGENRENRGNDLLTGEKKLLIEDDEGSEFDGTVDALITLINKERFDRELEPLKKNSLLMMSAKVKAKDMVKNKYFEHISREGIQPWFFAEKVGYRYQTFGENIAEEYFSANSVHKAFMDSEGHRANILNKEFKDVGVAILPVKINAKQQFVVVEHFGSYLKEVDLGEGKCGEKNRQRCKVQKKKRKELLKMIGEQKKIVEEIGETKNDVQKEVLKNNLERVLKDLNDIKKEVDIYLETCQKRKNSCD